METEENSLEKTYEGSVYDSSLETQATSEVIAKQRRFRLFRFNKLALKVTAISAGLIIIAAASSVFLTGSHKNKLPPGAQGSNFTVGSVSLKGLTDGESELKVGQADRLSVNGQLKVSNTLVLTPSSAPTAPQAGQIYYDKTTNQPYYYNRTTFVSLSPERVSALGGATGVVTLGSGLTMAGNQLSVSAALLGQVNSLQGLTGDVRLTSGNGISINGTTVSNTGVVNLTSGSSSITVTNNGSGNYSISSSAPSTFVGSIGGATGDILLGAGLNISGQTLSNSGVVSLTGTANQVSVSGGSGNVTLSLPQDIATTSTPTFGGLTVTNSASIGGTLAVTGSGGLTIGSGSVAGQLKLTNTTNPNLSILQSSAPSGSGNATYNLPTIAGGSSDTICLATLNNCGGSSSTVTASSTGTPNTLAKFTGGLTIANSSITDDGATVTVGATLSATTISTSLIQSSGALAITPGGALTIGATNQSMTLQGNASSTFRASSGGFTSTLGFTTPTANRTINLPNESGTICLQGSVNCGFASAGSGVNSLNSLAGVLTLANASGSGSTITIDNASTSAKGIAQFNATNFSVASGVVNTIQNIATTSNVQFGSLTLGTGDLTLSAGADVNTNKVTSLGSGAGVTIDAGDNGITFITQSGATTFLFPTTGGTGQVICTSGITCASGGGQAVILEPGGVQTASTNNTAVFINKASGSGNLIQLQAAGTDALVINNTGQTTIANATVSGTLTANTITPTSSLTVGSTGQSFTLQGNGSSVITATGGGFLTTVGFNIGSGGSAPTGNVTYQFQNDSSVSPGTYNVCTTAGNCAGVGGGITGSGTAGAIAKFTASGNIGNSLLSESGSTVTVAGNLAVGTSGAGQLTVGVSSVVNGTLVVRNSSNSNTLTINQTAAPSGNITIGLPNQSGTFAVAATGPIQLDATTGQISCPTCLTSGGGAGGGVVSIQGTTGGSSAINGALTLNNALTSGSTITIDNASTTQKGIAQFDSDNFQVSSGVVDTIQDIATTSSPTFANLTVQGSTGLTIGSSSNLGQLVFLDGSGSGFTTTFSPATLTGSSKTITIPNASGTLAVSASGNLSLSALGNLTITNSPNFTTSVTTPSLTSAGALSITSGGQLSVGSTGQQLSLIGNGSTTLAATASGQTSTVGFTTPTTNRSILFPDASGTICLQNSASCGFALAGNVVNSLNGLTGTLSVANASGSGSTITIDNASTSAKGIAQFNSTNFTASSGTINTIQDIATTSSPTFAALTSNGDITYSGSLVGNSFNPQAGVTYSFASASAGSYSICSTAGNCTGVGGGVTTPGGTTNRVAKFTAAQGIGDSSISDDGTTVSTTSRFSVTGSGNGTAIGALFKNASDSATAFQIQNAAGATLLNADTSTTSNLITNGGMEGAGIGGWTARGSSTLSQNSTHQWQGNNSLSVVTTTAANDGAKYDYTMATSTNYTLSLYAKVASGSITDVDIGRQDVSGSDINCLTGQTVTTNWTRFTCSFQTGGTITNSNIYIKKSGTSAETFYVDGIQLEAGTSATAFDPGGRLQLSGIVNSPAVFQNKSNSTTAFQIQNAAGTSNLFVADTINSRIGIGVAPANGILTVGTNTTAASGGLYFGTDTNLYRSASTTLTTDANLNVQRTSASALKIQKASGGTTIFNVDTNADTVAVTGALTVSSALSVTNNISITANGNSATTGFTKNYPVGTGGVTAGDAVSLIDDSGSPKVVKATTTNATNVIGVALTSVGSGSNVGVTLLGGTTVTADTVDVAIGDQMVVSSTSGQVTKNNNATMGIVGYATQAKAAGSSGSITINVRAYGGQNTPVFKATSDSATAFQIQEAGGTTILGVDTTNGAERVLIGGTTPTLDFGGTNTKIVLTDSTTLGITASLYTPQLTVGTTSKQAALTVVGVDNSLPTLYVKNKSGQTAEIAQFIDASNNTVASVSASGAALFRNSTNSTTAFQVQSAAGATTVLSVDTTNNRVGIGTATPGASLDVNGTAQANTLRISTALSSTGYYGKNTPIGTGGVIGNDVVILDSTGEAVRTTVARDPRVYGVAVANGSSTGDQYIAFSGNLKVTAETAGAVAIGDQLVTSTTAGAVMVDNNATTGILGIALTAKSAGVSGTVDVMLRPVGGQYSPIFRNEVDSATAFQIQNSSGGNILTANSSNSRIGIGVSGASAAAKLHIGSSAAIPLLRVTDSSGTSTDVLNIADEGAVTLRNASNSTAAFQVQDSIGTTILNVGTSDTGGNLLSNISFEVDSATWSGKGGASKTRVTSEHFIGSAAGSVTTTAAVGDGLISNTVGMVASTTYTFSVYAKANISNFSTFVLGRQDISGTDIDCATSYTILTNGWTRASCTFTTGGTVTNPKVYVEQSDATARTFYVDAMQLVAGSSPTPFTNGKITLNGVIDSPVALQSTTDSTTAFQIQNSAGTSNLFVADTTNSRLAVGGIPANALLTIGTNTTAASGGLIFGTDTTANLYRSASGTIKTDGNLTAAGTVTANTLVATSGVQVGSNVLLTGTSSTGGYISKDVRANGTVSTGQVVVVSTHNGTNHSVATTTTARDNKVFGVVAVGATGPSAATVVISGTVNAKINSSATVNPGDQLVTSTVAGEVMVDNSATTGIVGIAVGPRSGTDVPVMVRPVNGQTNPVFLGSGSGNVITVGTLTTAASSYQMAISTGGTTNSGLVIQTVASQSSGNILQAQDSTGAALATIDYQGNLTVKSATFNGTLTVNGHIITGNTSGSTSASPDANAGTSASCTVSGNDTSGQITLVTGSASWASGVQCTITFASAFGAAPRPVITRANGTSTSAVDVYVDSTTTTMTINFNNADTGANTYKFNYFNTQ